MAVIPDATSHRLTRLALAALCLPLATLPLHAAAHTAQRHPAVHTAAPARHASASASSRRAAPVVHDVAAKPHGAASHRHAEVVRAEAEDDDAARKRKPLVSMKFPSGRASRAVAAHEEAAEPVHRAVPAREEAAVRPAVPARAAVNRPAAEDAATDSTVSDRVHAWYRSRGLVAPDAAVKDAVNDDVTAKPAARIAVAAKPAPAKPVTAKAVPEPDLSLTARKATIDDFQRAAQARAEAIRMAAQQNQARTTAEDDAAEAESQIPRTAPTAREAAPFTHGDLLQSAAASVTADDLMPAAAMPGPATLAAVKPDAPKKFNTKPDAIALADTTSPTAGNKPAPIRIVAAETASTTTPKIQLPKPAPIVRQAPAVAAVTAAASKPSLGMDTAANMTANNFADDDDAPAATVDRAPTVAKRLAVKASLAEDDTEPGTSTPVKVNLYDGRGHLMMLPAMKGTHEILVHQNQMAVADGLERIADDDQMEEMRRQKLLVALPDNDAIQVNDPLPANRRYARPWTVRFLNDLSRAHYARFHTPLVITSAVRTVAFQRHLVMINGNAAPPTGDVASPHLYGQAVDLGKRGMSMTEIAWMRAYLTPVETAEKIDVEEEFQQACFHISVYRRYLGLPARKNTPAPDAVPSRATTFEQVKSAPAPKRHRLPTGLLATGLR